MLVLLGFVVGFLYFCSKVAKTNLPIYEQKRKFGENPDFYS